MASRTSASAAVLTGASLIFFAYIGFDAGFHRGRGDDQTATQPADRIIASL